MKKLLTAMMMIAALASLRVNANQYAMVSVFTPGQIPQAQEHLDGVRLNLIYGDCMSINGLDVGFMGRTRERFNGLQLAACNLVGTDARGCQLALLSFVNTGFQGFQFAPVWNSVKGPAYGFQLGGCNTAASGAGFQLGLVNLVDDAYAGFQCSLWNYAGGHVDGFQLGVVNYAGELDGLQVGLLNFIDQPHPTCYCLPIVNFGW